MKKGFDAGLALFTAILPAGFILAQSKGLEQKIWTLLDDGKAAYVSLAVSDLRALGAGLDLPDGGRSITALAGRAGNRRGLSCCAKSGARKSWPVPALPARRERRRSTFWNAATRRATRAATAVFSTRSTKRV